MVHLLGLDHDAITRMKHLSLMYGVDPIDECACQHVELPPHPRLRAMCTAECRWQGVVGKDRG